MESRQTIERHENTPFTIIGDDKGYYVVMGQYRLTDRYQTKEEVVAYIEEKSWELIVKVVSTMLEINEKILKEYITEE